MPDLSKSIKIGDTYYSFDAKTETLYEIMFVPVESKDKKEAVKTLVKAFLEPGRKDA